MSHSGIRLSGDTSLLEDETNKRKYIPSALRGRLFCDSRSIFPMTVHRHYYAKLCRLLHRVNDQSIRPRCLHVLATATNSTHGYYNAELLCRDRQEEHLMQLPTSRSTDGKRPRFQVTRRTSRLVAVHPPTPMREWPTASNPDSSVGRR